MSLNYLYPEFEVLRHPRCTKCRLCEKECSNKVHHYDATLKVMVADDEKCVNCHRCVSICPVKALKIARTNCTYRDDDNWTNQTIKEIYKQAESGGILLSSMGSPKRMPIYWDRLLINASQVTNPPIDPLREPMETRVFLGKKPNAIVRDAAGHIDTSNLAPHHDIYSIEDLRQLVYSLKEATNYTVPIIVKVAAVHNIAAITSGIARSGADIIAIDGFRGGTGAAPTRIRDNVGIPIELALAACDKRLREEGIRNDVSLVVGGSIRSAADVIKAIALGADACYVATAALMALGCHLCRSCQIGRCNWGIATQDPALVKRLNPDEGSQRLVNLMTAWRHEIKEMLGGMGINSIEALRGNRLMLRGIGLTEKELEILGVAHAGE